MIVVDGSIGEGGGQILRTALGLSAVLGRPVKVISIRAKRRDPGLQHQHLAAVRALQYISNARVEGDRIGSTELLFEPRGLRGGELRIDVGTAGSVTLVLQALLPVLPFLPSRTTIEIRGGTDVPWSPPIDYVKLVLIPIISRFGISLEVEKIRRGHYPRGGGIVRVAVDPPHELKPAQIYERGRLNMIKGVSHAVRLPKHVAERQRTATEETLRSGGIDVPIDIEVEYYEPDKDPHLGPGSGIVLSAVFEKSVMGSDALGERGKPAEAVGREAATKLLEEIRSGAALDRHAGDMVVALAALASGLSKFSVSALTLHTLTVIKIAEMLTGCRISLSSYELGKPFTMEVQGIGFKR